LRGMELWRPVWCDIIDDAKPRSQELCSVTLETARLALSAIREQNMRDYYHNYGAAARELREVLDRENYK